MWLIKQATYLCEFSQKHKLIDSELAPKQTHFADNVLVYLNGVHWHANTKW